MTQANVDSDSSDDESTLSMSGERLWDTLEHNGVIMAPPYVPHGRPIRYNGQAIVLHPEAEEVATMFAVMRESPYYHSDIFRRNFFTAWLQILHKHHRGHPIRNLDLVDFDEIYAWYLEQQRIKKERTPQEKKRLREEIKLADEPYSYCIWNGNKEPLARYKMEPPGLFRGRGAHPLAGCLKRRVLPEEVSINIGEEAVVPTPPPGHSWKAVLHDHTVAWMAMWRDTVTDGFKYVYPGPGSTFKNMSDMKKFERARNLAKHIDRIRESYRKDWRSPDRGVAQRAVAMYFIDVLALRVGNEKGQDEADTVGCCSLRVEHLTLAEGNVIKFDFLGKDSIRYQNDVVVDPQVYALIAKFTQGKSKDSDVFDALTTSSLNEHLKSFMPGLSAKVFRTYNASHCLEEQLRLAPPDLKTVHHKLEYFNRANTKVAILCNHQRSVPKNHHVTMATMEANLEYLQRKLRRLERAVKTSQKRGEEAAMREFYEDEDNLQREWLKAYGTEEQAEEYEAYVAERDAGGGKRVRSAPSAERKAIKEEDEDASLAAVLRGKKDGVKIEIEDMGGRGSKRAAATQPKATKRETATQPTAKASKSARATVKDEASPKSKGVKKEAATPPKAVKRGSTSSSKDSKTALKTRKATRR